VSWERGDKQELGAPVSLLFAPLRSPPGVRIVTIRSEVSLSENEQPLSHTREPQCGVAHAP
jgi:hypothetical protein